MTQNTYLGIDLGIGSCGWALTADDSLIALGSRTFDVPETDKERTPTNQLRRTARGLRRVISRRRSRMNEVRAVLARHGLLESAHKQALAGTDKINPWQARAEGLDRALSPRELALALGHIAKHRGFKSNSKRDGGANAADESGKMLAAAARLQEKEQAWRSVGEMFWKDPDLRDRKRNRDGDYSRSVLRADLEREVRLLLKTQRRLGNDFAGQDLEASFLEAAFFQRPLADSENKVGECPFEAGEKRAAKSAPAFEMFRLLTRLSSLRIGGRPLSGQEVQAAIRDFGRLQSLSFHRLRKMIDLPAADRFDGVPPDEESKRDVVARSGKSMAGSFALYKVLGDSGWESLRKTPDKLDRIAAIISFREDVDRIRAGLAELALEPQILDALMRGVETGTFAAFKGAGHISAKACRKLIPFLAQGLDYAQACEQSDYVHGRQQAPDLDDIANPIARKALGEALKQVNAIIRTYGKPTHIHVELARDVGKSLEQRQEIERGIDKRTKEKDKLRQQYRDTVGGEPTAEDLLRFELWKEQGGRSLYSDRDIHPSLIASSANDLQVDHILPWSRSGDDSFVNKTLCFTGENHTKKGRTPFEWFDADGLDWNAFAARVENSKGMKGRKKRNYLLQDASVLEERFKNRNLNDTRYACRLLLNCLKKAYPFIPEHDISARPGPLTDRLRRAWGLQGLKKNEAGLRIADDRHHALDAVIVALTSKSMLQRLSNLFQQAESRGLPTDWHGIGHLHQLLRDSGGVPREFSALEPPWPGFRDDVIKALNGITVSRAERRRARGQAHAATIRQISERDGVLVVCERKAIETLTEKDLDRVKDAERNHRVIAALRGWISEGKPKDNPPMSPQGHPIRKVRLETTKKVDVPVRGGAAERGEMARIDVFRKANKTGKWEYYLIPIYPHEVATLAEPPDKYVVAYKPQEAVTDEHQFLWSLYPMSWLKIAKSNGEVIEGYFRGMNRSTGALAVSPHHTNTETRDGIGAKTLASLRKFAVDRLGNLSEIEREIRTWHGKACT